jgi:two-component system response regulator FixJ
MSEALQVVPDGRVTVAIVDDDRSVRVAVTRVCSVFGLAPQAFGSGQEFLAALAEGAQFDCLLLDAHMPQMTGAELQRQLIARGIAIPTIIFTADDSAHMFLEHASMGALECLRKPVCSDILVDAICRAARRSSATGTF